MKKIDDKKYYISVGFIDKQLLEHGVDVKHLKSVFINSKNKKDGTIVYLDDTDKDNTIIIPLVPVNEIQLKEGIYKFRVLLNPKLVEFSQEERIPYNVIGLFEEYIKDGIQYIKNVKFFVTGNDTVATEYIYANSSAKTLSIEVEQNVIMGE